MNRIIREKRGKEISKIFSGITFSLLLVSVAVSVFNVLPVKAGDTIYIRFDGAIDPPSAPIQRYGDLYIVTGNITGDLDGIVIERDSITLDGAGYTIHGNGTGDGVTLSGRSNITIRNLQITGFNHGIYLSGSSIVTIVGNNISKNKVGIELFHSSNNNLSRNNIIWNYFLEGGPYGWNGYGIILQSSDYNCIIENNVTQSYTCMYLNGSPHNKISGNTISCESISFGQPKGVVLSSCSDNNITGNTIKKVVDGSMRVIMDMA